MAAAQNGMARGIMCTTELFLIQIVYFSQDEGNVYCVSSIGSVAAACMFPSPSDLSCAKTSARNDPLVSWQALQ